MRPSKDLFKKGINNSYSKIKVNPSTSSDADTYKREFTENKRKKEPTEATGTGSSGGYSQPLFSNTKPKKIETKEATGSGSVGAYETPSAWAPSMKSKEWRGKSKTQIPGGSFVSVKKKCKTFPYCNQGDIKSLNIYKNKKLKEAIENVSRMLNVDESYIKAMIEFEIEKLKDKYL